MSERVRQALLRAGAIVASGAGWPAVHLAVFALRFHRLPPGGLAEGLVFVPMGLVAGVAVVWLAARAAGPQGRRAVVLGYLLASPVGLLTSLLGGLVLPGIWGPLVAGGIPLVAGCVVGYFAGARASVD